MSQENVDHTRRGYALLADAMSAGDPSRLSRLVEERFDPEIVISPAGILPESGAAHGHDGALRFLATQSDAFEVMWFKPEEFRDTGDRVVVPVRVGGRARHTGIDLEFERVHVWTHRNGKVTRLEIFDSRHAALEAVGVSE
jgi:ketosteroid isomerase-like protein